MKNQKRNLKIFICILSMFPFINAQNIDIASESQLITRSVSPKIEAEGSPYINEDFSPVRISLSKDQLFAARYNAYTNEMEVQINDDKTIALDNSIDIKVTFTTTNKTYKTENYITDKGIAKRDFLVSLIENEKYSLLKEERINFYEKVEAPSSYQKAKPARFERASSYYYIKINNEVTFLPQKKNDFLKAFPKQASKLKSYLKSNKLNPKNEDELIEIIEYLNTL